MAQFRNPFDDSHVAPQRANPRSPVTTRHREIETARQRVQKEGASANKGRFVRVFAPYVPGKPVSPEAPYTRTFSAPGGKETVVVEEDRMKEDPATGAPIPPPASPHDRRIRINGEVMSEAAGNIVLKDKYGINLNYDY